jgi:hypothetical protein
MRERQDAVVYIMIDPIVLLEPGVVFSQVNARSPRASFYEDVGDLDRLDWETLNARYWRSNTLARQAEAQVPLGIGTLRFVKLNTYTMETRKRLMEMVAGRGLDLGVECDRRLYYND